MANVKLKLDNFPIAAEAELSAAIARQLAGSETPAMRYHRLSSLPLVTTGTGAQTAGLRRAMIRDNVVLDASKLILQPRDIEEFLGQHFDVPAALWWEVASAARLGDLDDLSERLAYAAEEYEAVIRHAIAGKLESAALAIPALGSVKPAGGFFTEEDEEELLVLVVDTSAYHQLIALWRAGLEAHYRCFKPTGIPALDRQPGSRATTVSHVAETILYNAEEATRVLKFFKATKNRSLTQEEEELIHSYPGLLDHGRLLEAELRMRFGRRTKAVVNQCHKLAHLWTRRIRRSMRAFNRKSYGNTRLTTFQGQDALGLLWLVCLQAAAWRVEDEASHNGVYKALRQIRAGKPPEPVEMPKAADFVARQLFFLVRNLVAKDPKSYGYGGTADAAPRIEEIEQAWATEYDKQRQGTAGSEGFSVQMTKGACKVYQAAVTRGDHAFLEEVRGPIWRQLHL